MEMSCNNQNMSNELSQAELAKCMRLLVKGGLLGEYEGNAVLYDFLKEDEKTITFVAGLYNLARAEIGEKWTVRIAKNNGKLASTPDRISITNAELYKIFDDTGLGTPETEGIVRYPKGAYGISYRVSVRETVQRYMVQLRYHGDVDSINAFVEYLHQNASSDLPIPRMFPTSVKVSSNMKVEVSEFIDGPLASDVYYETTLIKRISLVRQIARVFSSLWDLEINKSQNRIGEATFRPSESEDDKIRVDIGADRVHDLGGPFASVSAYLKAWVDGCIRDLEKRECVDEFKEDVLPGVRKLVKAGLNIPPVVEDVPCVVSHADLGLHNIILSPNASRDLESVIDWELVYCLPFAAFVPKFIEPLFWKDYEGKQQFFDGSEKLRDAFWGEIPKWRDQLSSDSAKTFLVWYEFGMKLGVLPLLEDDTTPEQRREAWKENTVFVKGFLKSQSISQ